MPLTVTRVGATVGARIEGIDLAAGLDDDTIEAIAEALYEHQVVSVAAPGLTVEQHLRIARRFGVPERQATDQFGTHPEVPEITVIDSANGDRADSWHADETFLEHPPVVNVLHVQQCPEVGGDTCFRSAAVAYEGLSPRFKALVDDLEAVHDYGHLYELGWRAGFDLGPLVADALAKGLIHTHPVVRTHPVTGRRWLTVNPTYTRFVLGLEPAEAEAVLAFLLRHLDRPAFGYRHRWQPGDLLLWDQQAVQHFAVNDAVGRRVVHRIAVLDSDETYTGVRTATAETTPT